MERGVVVEIDPNIEAFVPMNYLGVPDLKKPEDAFKVGDTIPLRIIEVDKNARKIVASVSEYMKAREEDELSHYVAAHPVSTVKLGDAVDGKKKKKKDEATEAAAEVKAEAKAEEATSKETQSEGADETPATDAVAEAPSEAESAAPEAKAETTPAEPAPDTDAATEAETESPSGADTPADDASPEAEPDKGTQPPA
jgi:small subunit ribosomal protein S1